MATQLDENTQYIDEATGELLNNGYIYIGLDGLDAKLNPKSIYSDRALSVTLSNIGADGRALNKIWIDGKYSLKVEDSGRNQKLNDLSLGIITQDNNISLINVQGTDSLTADASTALTALTNNQVYILTAANTNTGAMTLTIDLTPTWPIKKHHDNAMQAGDIEVGQTLAVIWNETDSVFELMTNSAIGPVNLANPKTVAGVKTFSDGIISNVTGDLTGEIHDSNGNEVLKNTATASAVNEITINNAATGNAPEIIPSGDDANIDLQLNGKGAGRVIVPFRGALVTWATTQIINTGSEAALTFDTESYDTDSIHDNVTNNTRMTVPSGVTKVRLSMYAQFPTNSTGYRQIRITKGGSSFTGNPIIRVDASATSVISLTIASAVVTVTGGDYFEAEVLQNSGGNLTLTGGASGHWFAMEIIE
jgi:hypothetical protein